MIKVITIIAGAICEHVWVWTGRTNTNGTAQLRCERCGVIKFTRY